MWDVQIQKYKSKALVCGSIDRDLVKHIRLKYTLLMEVNRFLYLHVE